MSGNLPNDLRLNLSGRSGRDVEFSVDKDDELEIAMEHYEDHEVSAWLSREEGKRLLDLLTRWLA